VILAELRAPTAFGPMALLGQGMDGDFAEAVEESLVCAVDRQVLERLLRRRPDVALRLLDLMGRRLWELERRVEEMATLTASQRLAAMLVRLADEQTGIVEGLTQEELADMSGTTRQTVARILGTWRCQGLIRIKRRSLQILHRDRLAALATSS
jgi:CRP-like cAMP-binding protein